MTQWINLKQNNSFVNQMRSLLLCEKSGHILLVLVGLIMAGRQAGQQSDKILVDSENFKILYQLHCWDFQSD